MLPNYSVSSYSAENTFNCTLRSSEEIEGPLKYTATIQRCEMDLSKCEFFNTIETDALCELFSDPTFTARFLNSVSPPLTCPTKPGDYVFLNNKWDLSAVVRLPGSAYRWNIVTTVDQIATGRTVFCSEMMARIVVLRKKSNRIKH
uniref:MD-2-related lipid-recognition domain-containing protein n=1 Tax=Anopheles farauti TaxID=69004 RepID=A0A182QRB3_9DIPT